MSGGFLSSLKWTKISNKNVSNEVTDFINLSAHKSTEIKNNILKITLKNAAYNWDGNYISGKYVDSNYNLIFQEEDQFELYLKFTSDGNDYNTTWQSTDNIIGRFVLEEYDSKTVENNTQLTLNCVDRAFLLFNKVANYSFGIASNYTSPGVFRQLCRSNSESISSTITKFKGTNNDEGVDYALSAKFLSEGGYIKDYRSVAEGGPNTTATVASGATTINVGSTSGFKSSGSIVLTNGIITEHVSYTGTTSTSFTGCSRGIDDTKDVSHSNVSVYQGFPLVMISKTWKPLFDWFNDISQTTNVNYSDEIKDNAYFYNRSFMLWVDKENEIHWMSVSQDVDLTINGDDADFRSYQLERSVFDSINFVIYNCGEDMYGHGILYYWYDETSDIGSLKMRYEPMIDITNNFINDDINDYNTTRDTTSEQDKLRQFPSSGSYPINTWSFKTDSNLWRNSQGLTERTSLTSDADYNNSLREAAKWRGLTQAKHLTSKLSGLRYRGKIILKGQYVNPGDLLEVSNRLTGIINQKLRVLDVTHQVNKNKWEVVCNVEEDEKSVQ